MFSNLWQRLAQLDGAWRVSVEGKLTETSPLRRYWRITLSRRGPGDRGRITVEDDMLLEALVRAVCAAEAQDVPRMRTTSVELEAGEGVSGPGPPDAGGERGRGAQQGCGGAAQERAGEDPEPGESSFFTMKR